MKYAPWSILARKMVTSLDFGSLVKRSLLGVTWVFAGLLIVSQLMSFHTAVKSEGLRTSERIAESLSEKLLAPLLTGDYELAEKIINKSIQDKNIYQIDLVVQNPLDHGAKLKISPASTEHKSEFAKWVYESTPSFLVNLAFPRFSRPVSPTIYQQEDFEGFDITNIGTLEYSLDFTESLKRQGIILLIAIFLLACSLLFLSTLSRMIEKHCSKPLSNLLAAMRKLESSDFAVAAHIESSQQSEINELIDYFKQHNNLIIERNRELKDSLESRDHIIQERTKDLQAALVEANQSAQSKANFINIMSHELNQPLFSARMALANMDRQSDGVSDTTRHYIGIVNQHLDNATSQIKHVLEYTGKGSQSYKPKSETFDFYRLAESLITSHATSAASKGLYLDLVLSHHLPNTIISCPDGWRQVLNNLIGNAIKYTQEGGVVIKISAEQFDTPTDFHLRVDVSDTGIGIAQEDLSKIFEYYTQAGDATKRTQGGYGIGLGIVDNYVKSLSGERSVVSSSEGSTFSVTIPVKRAAKPLGVTQTECITMIGKMRLFFVLLDNRKSWRDGLESRINNISAHCLSTDTVDEAMSIISRQCNSHTVVCIGRTGSDSLVAQHLDMLRAANPRLLVGMHSLDARSEGQALDGVDLILDDAVEITEIIRQIHAKIVMTAPSPTPVAATNAPVALKDKRILLIDDNYSNLEYTKDFLCGFGAEIDIAHGPREGIKKAMSISYDAICIDIMMPEINGIEVAGHIRSGSVNEASALFAFTAGYLNDEQTAEINTLNMRMLLKMDAKDKMVKEISEALA